MRHIVFQGRRGFFVVAIMLVLSGAFCVSAEEADRSDDAFLPSTSLDTIVVTAADGRSDYQTGDVDTEDLPSFYSVINRDSFEGKMDSLAEVIEKEAGVQIRRSGGLGSFSSMTLRGSTSEQVMIYVDGVLLNDASGGGVDLSNISLAEVDAIEIYRGMTPIHFGTASIGGAVNIRTIRSRSLKMNLSAGYGSFNTRSGSAFISHKPGQWDYLISADYLDSDNDFKFVYDNQTRFNSQDDSKVRRHNAQFDQLSLLARVGCDIDRNRRVEAGHQYFSKNQGLPSRNNSPRTGTSFDTRQHMSTLKLTVNDFSPLSLDTRTLIDYSIKKEEYDDRQGEIGLGRQRMRYLTEKIGGGVFLEKNTPRNSLVVNIEGNRETYTPENLLKGVDMDESSRDRISFGLQNRLLLFQERLAVIPALRYTQISDQVSLSEDFLDNPEDALSSRKDDYFTPQFGLRFHPADWITLKTNLARYQRDPSFFELFGDRGFFLGNVRLKPEQGINFDAGLECRWFPAWTAVDGLTVQAAYFQSDVDDLISRVYDARGIGRSVNIAGSFVSGVEAGLDLDFLEYFTLTANATLQDTENQSGIKAFDGKKLPGRFEKSYLGRLTARLGGMKIFTEYAVEKDMYYDTANLLKAADKYELNAGLAWEFRSILFSLEAKNIGDNQYEDFNGYPLPGRAFYGKIKYTVF